LWDVTVGERVRTVQGPGQRSVARLSVSPGGKRFLAANLHPGAVWACDVTSGQELWRRPARTPAEGDAGLGWLDEGRQFLMVSAQEAKVRIGDAETGEVRRSFSAGSSILSCSSLSPDGKWLLTGESFTGVIRLFEVATGREVRHWQSGGLGVSDVAFSPDGRFALATDTFPFEYKADASVHLWDVDTGREVHRFGRPGLRFQWVAYAPDGRTFLTAGSRDAKLREWEIPKAFGPK
jgi:WD40 repeat protein